MLENKSSLVSTDRKGNGQGQRRDNAADASHSTPPHKPDVEVKGNTALYFEFLSSRLLKNALFCRGRIRRVILHQLTVKKPENNTILSKGCSASQTRSASIDRQSPIPCMEEQRPGAVAEDAWEANKQCLMHKKGKKSSRFSVMQRTSRRKAVSCPGSREKHWQEKRRSLAGCCLHAYDPSVKKTSRLLTSIFSQQQVCIKCK